MLNKTLFSFSLLLVFTQGAMAQERTITTKWHPKYRLPIEINEFNKKTTFVYDDNTAVLLQKTISTTSPTATSLTWKYTYGQFGLMLTENGPRTDVNDITTYDYNIAKGELLSVKNALNHTTQFTQYDAHGAPLKFVDPNGLVTELTYNARKKLTSRKVGSQLTTFEYDKVLQLKKVTLPDGSFLQYEYDAAHRLDHIRDALGNTIVYTLDPMSNIVREDVHDTSGMLVKNRFQIYNQLAELGNKFKSHNLSATASQLNPINELAHVIMGPTFKTK